MTVESRWAQPDLGRVVCISQARFGSQRLPGKVLMEVAGEPLLAWHLNRLKRCRTVDQIALATSDLAADDAVADLARSLGVAVFRGSESDVLARFVGCARMTVADVVVRVTADCPLIDPGLIDQAVLTYARGRGATPPVDYLSIDTNRYPRGLDAEVFDARLLTIAAMEATDPAEREHVTPFIYRRPDRFHIGRQLTPDVASPPSRWCVDEASDLALVRHVLEFWRGRHGASAHAAFDWRDCLKLLADNPEWATINRDVAQRKVS